PGIRFVSLQKELNEDERGFSEAGALLHVGADLKGTAEIIAALDLVISVDTVLAHLAGAMGRPLWVLLSPASYWIWFVDREDSPWYPTARLFRQSQAGSWEAVARQAARELAGFAGRGPNPGLK